MLVAEGVGSSTRELVLPGENDPRWMDMTLGFFTIPKGETDSSDSRWYNAPGGRSVFLRPDRYGTTRAVLTLNSEAREPSDRSEAEQKAWLHETFADAGWETPRVLDGLDEAEGARRAYRRCGVVRDSGQRGGHDAGGGRRICLRR